MISENQNQSVEVPIVEKKTGAPKRNYNKKEKPEVKPKPKARPKREKKQSIETPQNDVSEEIDYEKVKHLIETNPSIAEEFQSIIKKHLK